MNKYIIICTLKTNGQYMGCGWLSSNPLDEKNRIFAQSKKPTIFNTRLQAQRAISKASRLENHFNFEIVLIKITK